jgi:hypothetical protein
MAFAAQIDRDISLLDFQGQVPHELTWACAIGMAPRSSGLAWMVQSSVQRDDIHPQRYST